MNGCLDTEDADDFLLDESGLFVATAFQIDVKATYLRNNEPNLNVVTFYDLSLTNISPGDSILLERSGEYNNTDSTMSNRLIAVFASENEIDQQSSLFRINAIDSGIDIVTPLTYLDSTETDIPEDFEITQNYLSVPENARYIFFSALDNFFGDNTDEDGDFGIIIYKIDP